MDKKNTMLLTVIAVATLLVAVVGATFAYFSVTGSTTNNVTNVTTTTATVGTVSLTQLEDAMHITTVSGDFAYTAQGHYWAVSDETNYLKQTSAPTATQIFQAVADAGTNAVYACTFDLSVVTSGLSDVTLHSNEYVVYVNAGTASLTLDMATAANKNTTRQVTLYLTNTTAKYVTANAELVNTTESDQASRLSGKTITTSFSVANLNCDTITTAESDAIGAAA